MSDQQYTVNTDKPHQDSFLWSLGQGWKVSQKTGDAYAPIDTIEDEVLGTTLTDISETGKIDVIDYQSYFFVPNKFVSKAKDGSERVSWSVFAFENRVKADKKLAEIKKFANFKPKQQTTTTTVPKPIPTGQQTISTTTPTRPQLLVHADTGKAEILNDTVTTFTNPTPVDYDNKELIATLQQDGYSFLPRTLVEKNFWEQEVIDTDAETGNNIVVGTKLIFLMGRIINVKIADI